MFSLLAIAVQLFIVLLLYFSLRKAICIYQASIQNKILANKTEFTVDEYQDLLIAMFERVQKSKESFENVENIEGTVDDDRAVFMWIKDGNWLIQRWVISRDLSRKMIIVARASAIAPQWTLHDLIIIALLTIALFVVNHLLSLNR